jgi:release factor glutamine methyltransferase
MVTLASLFSYLEENLAPLSLLPSSRRLEAKELACLASGTKPSEFWIRQEMQLPLEVMSAAEALLARRLQGEPLAYLLGAWDFYGRTFQLNTSCLIPRADSETMIDTALDFLKTPTKHLDILDLCCGSGCLGITLALELAKKNVTVSITLADISSEALAMAVENARHLGVTPTPTLLNIDALADPVPATQWDVILFNPPYLTTAELTGPYKDSLAFEPALALDGGADGLVFYRAFSLRWLSALAPGGLALLEIGQGQAETVLSLLAGRGLTLDAHADLTGIKRIISAQKDA